MMRGSIGIILACGFLAGCEKAALRDETPVETHETATQKYYPFFRDLTDLRGRVVEAEVLGRDHNSVTFVRWSDKKRFTVPLASLSRADQTYLLSLPAANPRSEDFFGMGPIEEEPATPPSSRFENRGYVKILEGRIADAEREIAEAYEESRDTETGTIAQRSLSSRIVRLRKEIIELQKELEEARRPR